MVLGPNNNGIIVCPNKAIEIKAGTVISKVPSTVTFRICFDSFFAPSFLLIQGIKNGEARDPRKNINLPIMALNEYKPASDGDR